MSLGVLVVHGMGRQEPGFAEGLRAAVSARLGAGVDAVESGRKRCGRQSSSRARPRCGTRWRRRSIPAAVRSSSIGCWVREFVLHNFGDATAYQRDHHIESAGQLIHQRISNAIEMLAERLGDPSAPIVVMAHSLGGHIMSNYIWDRQHPAADPQPGSRWRRCRRWPA